MMYNIFYLLGKKLMQITSNAERYEESLQALKTLATILLIWTNPNDMTHETQKQKYSAAVINLVLRLQVNQGRLEAGP